MFLISLNVNSNRRRELFDVGFAVTVVLFARMKMKRALPTSIVGRETDYVARPPRSRALKLSQPAEHIIPRK